MTARRSSTSRPATVLHNLLFGCLLIFLIQWIFLGDLRSAIIVGVNIPFALFFSIIVLVLRNEDANLLSVGAVDFGIIVDAAVILVENIYPQFPGAARNRDGSCCSSSPKDVGERIRRAPVQRTGRVVDRPLATHSASARCRSTGPCSSPPRSWWRHSFRLFTMQGVEGQIFSPMARTYGYALVGALHRDVHGHSLPRIAAAARACQ